MDTIYVTGHGWRSCQLRRGRSDHVAFALVRDGRVAEAWKAAVDDRPPIAKTQGSAPKTTSVRECVRANLSRSLVGARSCAYIKRGPEAAARAVEVARDRLGRVAWRAGLKIARMRARMRMRQSGEEGGGVENHVLGRVGPGRGGGGHAHQHPIP